MYNINPSIDYKTKELIINKQKIILIYNDILVNKEMINTFYDDKWPIYTKTHNTPPARYLGDCSIKNSFVSNGYWFIKD